MHYFVRDLIHIQCGECIFISMSYFYPMGSLNHCLIKPTIMKTIISILLLVLVVAGTSCASTKYGCPGSNSQGRVPGAFKS
jgi:hypothetical protein